jgi:hypothetical protein
VRKIVPTHGATLEMMLADDAREVAPLGGFGDKQAVPPTEPAPAAPRPVQIPPPPWAENKRAEEKV